MIADTLTLEIANGINDRSARGIATAIGRMISSGELVIGAQLPTVRQLSRQLHFCFLFLVCCFFSFFFCFFFQAEDGIRDSPE